jgi:glycine dehydrogenase subunit 1
MAVERTDGDGAQEPRRRRRAVLLGCGAYRHHVPASVDHIIQRGEFLTSYTPYQPEIAQGTLQVLFEFQTQVARLYRLRGRQRLDVRRLDRLLGSDDDGPARHPPEKAILSGGLHPHYVRRTQTMAHRGTWRSARRSSPPIDAEAALIAAIDAETACVVVQTPTSSAGHRRDEDRRGRHAAGALLIVVVTEPVSLRPDQVAGRDGRRHRRRPRASRSAMA